MIRWYYMLLLLLATPIIWVLTLQQAWKRQGGKQYLQQRCGFGYQQHTNRPLWIHAASVGEINTVWPLLELLWREYPDLNIVLTTNTPSGFRLAQRKTAKNLHCYYLPLDYRYPVQRFLRSVRPYCGLIVETEIWWNLLTSCRQQAVPVYIINGRLSDKTLQAPWIIKPVLLDAVSTLTGIWVRSEDELVKFRQLGAEEQQLVIVGNLKFAVNTEIQTPKHDFLQRQFILAISTHHDEEVQLVQAWLQLPEALRCLLVIAPRHPERSNFIAHKLTELGVKIARRSRNDAVVEATNIYLLDVIGELPDYLPFADLVFVGGSLVARGGQNMLEPACYGKAIITGPMTPNFTAEMSLLLAYDAIEQLKDNAELPTVLEHLLTDAERRKKLGENARQCMLQQANVAQRYLWQLQQQGILVRPKK